MYLVAFGLVFPWPTVAMLAVGAFIVLAQVKINVTNAYAGSIAWSNFSRLTHSPPGRVVWLVFNVGISLLLMEFGIYEGLEPILTLFSILATSWLGIIFADLVINKPLGLSPAGIEFRRAYLYDINPVGLGSMAVSTVAATLAHIGTFGDTARGFAVFLALGVALIMAPLIATANARPLLSGASTGGDADGWTRLGALLHLRIRIRTGRHGVLPCLRRTHLFAVLFPGRPLP